MVHKRCSMHQPALGQFEITSRTVNRRVVVPHYKVADSPPVTVDRLFTNDMLSKPLGQVVRIGLRHTEDPTDHTLNDV